MPGPAAGAIWTFATAVGAWAVRMVKNYIGPLVAQLLVWMGLQVAVNEFAVEPIIAEIQGALSGAPANFMDVINYVEGGRAIAMVLTAYAISVGQKAYIRKKPSES